MPKIFKIYFTDKSNKLVEITGNGPLSVYKKVLDWLIDNDYSFSGVVHNPFIRKIFTRPELDELFKKTSYDINGFYNIKNSGKYILIAKGNISERLRNMQLMLSNFGIDESTIKFEGFDNQSTSVESEDHIIEDDIDVEDVEEVTPMRSLMLQDFWTIFKSEIDNVSNLYLRRKPTSKIFFHSATGISSINYVCLACSKYARVEIYFNKSKEENKKIFDYFLSIKDEIQSKFGDTLTFERMDYAKASRIKYQIDTNVYDKNNWSNIINFFKLNVPKFENTFQPIFDEIIKNPLILNKSNEFDNSITPASDYIESKKPKTYVKNPFRQSICILGPSGKGKSFTTDLMLEQLKINHKSEFEFIIPTASTTGLLSQYSPKGEYIPSRLGKMITYANEHNDEFVTAVFDECHKSAVIEMINDELLQCISLYRNNGKRFISVDDETAKLYEGLEKFRGNLLLPDNFGFIFLSSKPDVIVDNSDFFNRVDIYILTEQPPKDADLSIEFDTEGKNLVLPKYFEKVESKDKSGIDKIKQYFPN